MSVYTYAETVRCLSTETAAQRKRNYLDVASSAERLVARRRIVMAIAVSRGSFPLVPAEEVTETGLLTAVIKLKTLQC